MPKVKDWVDNIWSMGWNYEKKTIFLSVVWRKWQKEWHLDQAHRSVLYLYFHGSEVLLNPLLFSYRNVKCWLILLTCKRCLSFLITPLILWPSFLLGCSSFILVYCLSLLFYLAWDIVHCLGSHNVCTTFPLIFADFITFFPSILCI